MLSKLSTSWATPLAPLTYFVSEIWSLQHCLRWSPTLNASASTFCVGLDSAFSKLKF
jgi:hypothetical protein